MKKITLIAALMLISIGVFAQGKVAIGANAGVALYGNSYNPFGLGAKLQYEFVENVRAEVAYNYWFEKENQGLMDVDLSFQYLVPLSETINLYPLAGINLGMTHGKEFKEFFGGQESIFGFQAGLGIEFYLNECIKANVDAKYQHNKKTKSYDIIGLGTAELEMKYNGPVIQAGIAYVF